MVDHLVAAVAVGDSDAVMALLADDVVLVTDGGPHRHAARRPVVGPFRVARFLCTVAKRFPPGIVPEPATVNAAPGYCLRLPTGQADAALAADVVDGRIRALWVVTNPAKLTGLDGPAPLV